jgi:hypothetical protein
LCSEEYLFYLIDNDNGFSVLKRSFSILVLALIVNLDNSDDVVDKDLVTTIIKASIKYSKEEKNYIGYVKGCGWSHCVAHLADLYEESMSSKYCTLTMKENILSSIKTILHNGHTIFQFCEEERILAVIRNC